MSANTYTKLNKAIKKGDIDKFCQILSEEHVNLNAPEPKSGQTLLQLAMINSQYEIVDELLQNYEVDPQKPSLSEQLPIQTALFLNSPELIMKLINRKINPNKKGVNQQTALQTAIINKVSFECIKKLIDNHFDINEKVEQYGSLLNLAIEKQLQEYCLFLLQQDRIRINKCDISQNTCLILAVKNNQPGVCSAILNHIQQNETLSELDKQFFINAQNHEGNTALHEAIFVNSQIIIDMLIERGDALGIDVTIANKVREKPNQLLKKASQNKIKDEHYRRMLQEEKKMQAEERRQQKRQAKLLEEKKQKQQSIAKKIQKQRLKQALQKVERNNQMKTLWGVGIGLVVILAIMYLVILNSIEKK